MTQPLPAGVPSAFKHYQVIRVLGQGGMGTVYEGFDQRVGQRVAIKVLHPHLAASDPTFTERFEREAHVAALLRSPYTVHLIDFGVQDGRYFLVMEYVEGQSLSDILRGGPLDANRALWIAGEVARALEEAQARGIVHRDIKPDNILFDQDGRVKVTDFGIARSVVSGGVTVAGGFVGTPAYAAPEQVDGNVDHRSDIYALGITLYAMLTGRPPYQGNTPMDTLMQHRTAPLPTQPIAHLPHPVQSIIRRATEKDPLDRYQSAAELAGAIDRARQVLSRGSQAAPGSRPVPPVAPPAATQAAPPVAPRPAAPLPDQETAAMPPPGRRASGGATPEDAPTVAARRGQPPATPPGGPRKRRNMVYYYAGGMVAGVALAIGLALFLSGGDGGGGDEDASPSPPGGAVASDAAYELTAIEFAFDRPTLLAPPNTLVTFSLHNEGRARHSLQFKDRAGGQELAPGATGKILESGETGTVTFTTPGPGTYYFECANHPSRMNGTFEVKEGAPAPRSSPTAGDGRTIEMAATGFVFSQGTIEASAGERLTVTLTNNDSAPHSVQFRTEQGGPELTTGASGPIVNGGEKGSFSFTAPGPGTYWFECAVHPGQMNGTFVVHDGGSAAQPATATPSQADAVAVDVSATGFAFNVSTIEATAGAEVTVTFRNNDSAPHSVQFRTARGGTELTPGATGQRITAGQTDTFTFRAPAAGTYHFECGVHPAQMNGTFVVKASGQVAPATATPLPSVTAPAAVSRLGSGVRAQVVGGSVNLTQNPSIAAPGEIARTLHEGEHVIVATNTPPKSTYHITEGVIFWRVVVEGTQTVGWVPEVTTDGARRWLQPVN